MNSRNTPDKCFLFINDRPCDLPRLTRLIHQQYKEFVKGKYPAYFVNMTLEPGFFDVNVTPDKRTILIQQEESLFEWISQELNSLFEPFRQSDHIFQSKKTVFQSFEWTESKNESCQSQESSLSFDLSASNSIQNEIDSFSVVKPLKEITNITNEIASVDSIASESPKKPLSILDLGCNIIFMNQTLI